MTHSTLDPDEIPIDDGNEILKGHDVSSLGPSDSSDSGSDLMGLNRQDDTSDRNGTGEGASVGEDNFLPDNGDIGMDRVVRATEAGLGGGLDQAEEAQLGITDEELEGLDEVDDED